MLIPLRYNQNALTVARHYVYSGGARTSSSNCLYDGRSSINKGNFVQVIYTLKHCLPHPL